jgi:hypothetical protein
MRRIFRLGVLLAAGCTILNGYSVEPDAGPDATSSDAPVPPSDAGTDLDPCQHVLPPGPPPADAATPGAITFVSTAKSVDFGVLPDGGTGAPIGFDLDRTCTCTSPAGSCAPPPNAGSECDFPGGIDDAVRDLVATAQIGGINFTHDTNDNIATGANTFLVWLQNYNGEADDPDVQIAVLYSPGLHDDAGANVIPTFTASDRWSVTSDEVYVGTTTPQRLVPGYVTGHTLVVNGAIALPILPDVTIELSEALLVAKIDATNSYLESGTVAGRAPAGAVIRALGAKVQSGKRLCDPANGLYYVGFQGLASRLCQARDIMANPADDGQGKSCDAISVALTFFGAPASIGSVRDAGPNRFCVDAAVPCP